MSLVCTMLCKQYSPSLQTDILQYNINIGRLKTCKKMHNNIGQKSIPIL